MHDFTYNTTITTVQSTATAGAPPCTDVTNTPSVHVIEFALLSYRLATVSMVHLCSMEESALESDGKIKKQISLKRQDRKD